MRRGGYRVTVNYVKIYREAEWPRNRPTSLAAYQCLIVNIQMVVFEKVFSFINDTYFQRTTIKGQGLRGDGDLSLTLLF